eukprot:6204243-Pleurochrysis_carterae.AAC.2
MTRSAASMEVTSPASCFPGCHRLGPDRLHALKCHLSDCTPINGGNDQADMLRDIYTHRVGRCKRAGFLNGTHPRLRLTVLRACCWAGYILDFKEMFPSRPSEYAQALVDTHAHTCMGLRVRESTHSYNHLYACSKLWPARCYA